MKVCLINTNIAWGGGEKWHFNQAKVLSSAGFDVSFIVHPNSSLYEKIKPLNYTIHLLKIKKFSFLNLIVLSNIKKLFKEQKFDSIIMNLPQDVKTFAKVAFKSNIQKIIYRRGMDHPIKASFINKKIYPKYVTHFIANSLKVKASIHKYMPDLEERIHVIYNGVDLLEIPPVKRVEGKLILGNLGRLVEQKGQKYLIELAVVLLKKELDFEIHIAGVGPLKKELKELIQTHGVQDQVKLVGHVSADTFLKSIDFFVFPSLFEGLSNALLEAQLYRKPTFAFNTSSNEEIITHNKNGFISTNFDTKDMALKILRLVEDTTLQEQIRENSLTVLKEKFDQRKLSKQLIGLLNE